MIIYQLVCKQQNGLQAELAVAKVEKVLQTWDPEGRGPLHCGRIPYRTTSRMGFRRHQPKSCRPLTYIQAVDASTSQTLT